MQVSILAFEAGAKIGANTQLIRTGALYHDIGKMVHPAFFTENQKGNIIVPTAKEKLVLLSFTGFTYRFRSIYVSWNSAEI
jgi:putative nucleotidyltransferase with HDIG domain